MNGIMSLLFGGSLMFFAASPSSTNYNLKSYDFGNGGTDSSTSTNYSLNGDTGTVSGNAATSTTFTTQPGLNPTQNANVPPAPTLSNPDGYYDQLKLVINQGNNPSDTKYLIAVSSDNFATTRYVQTDNSIGASYTLTSYQTYASWGGATGFYITGLLRATTYEVKVKALQGNFSETGFGPKSAAVATLTPSLSFGLTTTLTASPPFGVNFSSLSSGTVFSGDADGTIALSSNARFGWSVYIKDANAGLRSTRANFTVASATANLAVVASGYGAQVTSASQTTGGPFVSAAPYNGAAQSVGAISTSLQPILGSTSPVFGGNANVRFMAKTDAITPAETDYADIVTFIAAMNY